MSQLPQPPIRHSAAQIRAAFELVGAGTLWGFGFVAAVWALRGMGPLAVTGWRFAIAALVGSLMILAVPSLRKQVSREQFLLAAIPGFLISLTLVFQTWGLRYTTATKCGLITTLYVILVPLGEWLWLKKRPPRIHFFCVLLALVGVYLICIPPNDVTGVANGTVTKSAEELAKELPNFGDFLTFLCAIAATLHILWFGYIQKRIQSAFVFNNFQSLWAGTIPFILALFLEPAPQLSMANNSLVGFLSLVFGSTMIAFALQVRAQKVISPSLASLLFLLESPFATFFAFLLLGENLQLTQWIGAGAILVAAALSTAFTVET